jgi:hypothetical protein
MLLQLMYLFGIFSVFAMIVMIIYRCQGGSSGFDISSMQLTMTFGNMGFPESLCNKDHLNADSTIRINTMC